MMESSSAHSLRVLAQLNERDLLPVVRDVCRAHGVTLEELCGTLISRSVHRARQEAWWRVRNHPGRHYSFNDLGRIFARPPEVIRQGVHAHASRLATPSCPKPTSNAIAREKGGKASVGIDAGDLDAGDLDAGDVGIDAGDDVGIDGQHFDRLAATLEERILSLVQTGSYTSANRIVQALVASGEGARRVAVFAAVRAMIAEGRLSKVDKVLRAADP